MRKTKKYREAIGKIESLGLEVLGSSSHAEIYEGLERHNYFWNAKAGDWEHKEYKPSTSIFEADNGDATGVIRLRVMAHPHDVEEAVKRIKELSGLKVVEISDTYANRKGKGVRVYITGLLI